MRRRRRRPVDLRLPRRDDPQHPRVRARLPGRHDDPARAELPLHPDDPAARPTRSSRSNTGRRPKNLWTDAGDGELIDGYVADNEHDEAAWVAEQIDALVDEGAAQPKDVAVFYRTNAPSRVFEEVFIRVGLPYKVVGGVRFYERKEVRDALAYLRVVANPDDVVSLRRILNTPQARHRRPGRGLRRAVRRPRADRLRRRAAPVRRGRPGSPPARSRRSRSSSRCSRSSSSWSRPARARPRCWRASSTAPATSPSCRPAPTRRTRAASRTSTSSSRWPPSSRRAQPGRARSTDFLEQVSLVADADQIPVTGDDAGVVTLMTLHTAKGLEFPVVFLTGLEDGVFPHLRALGDPRELEEERRLAYVGITRAQQRLYLSRAQVAHQLGAARPTTRRPGSSTRCPPTPCTGRASGRGVRGEVRRPRADRVRLGAAPCARRCPTSPPAR